MKRLFLFLLLISAISMAAVNVESASNIRDTKDFPIWIEYGGNYNFENFGGIGLSEQLYKYSIDFDIIN
ncbi:MAG: hypothetical protein CR982_10350 [Candidatus Cloacimonadota bacterium]|nr:MAG: hypothetical protein CR982_10350 [Candidatus Cloacimonadota bacterium]PIE79101.1 MAG: hypothetical protein CSA15_04305 [Candidatus Delongbacteria bacterium]